MWVLQDRNGFLQPHSHIWGNKAVTHHFHFPPSLWMRSQYYIYSTGVITSAAVLPWEGGDCLMRFSLFYAPNLASPLHQLPAGISSRPTWTPTNCLASGHLPRFAFSRSPPAPPPATHTHHSELEWDILIDSPGSTVITKFLFAYFCMQRWVRKLPCPLV